MMTGRQRRKKKNETLTVGTQSDERILSSEEINGDDLLPGIPNDVTLHHITPKLPWRAFYILALVSHAWKQAIQTRNVYDARLRFQSTETLVVVSQINIPGRFRFGYKNYDYGIGLYSIRDDSCYQLPILPESDPDIPESSTCISMDGKIYVLGGESDPYGDGSPGSDKVYVLDIAGQRKWKQCASMLEPRQDFGCGIVGGKIYVFGGRSGSIPNCGSEVYDPEVNAWSPIMPMPSWRVYHDVTTLGDELFVHGGNICDPKNYYSDERDDDAILDEATQSVEVYNPLKDEWRVVKYFLRKCGEMIFLAQGKFHSISEQGIFIHNADHNSWRRLHSNSFATIRPKGSGRIVLNSILAVNDDLFLLALRPIEYNTERDSCLLRSKVVTSQKKILWQKANWLPIGDFPSLCPIEL